MRKKLEGKVAVVTGGSRDLGRAVSIKLAREGAKVCVNYRGSEEDAQETLRLIKAEGGEAIIVKGDMTKAADVKNLFEKTREAFGPVVHVLVNVVGGIMGRKTVTEQDEDWYNLLMDVNFKSVWLCTREAVPAMTEGGAIVNFSSQAARDGGGPGASLYATSKAAVLCYTRAMAKELGPAGIRVNAVTPGMINTSFHDKFTKPAARENLHASAPLRREGEASEVADLVCFLACDESSYITGTGIDINGGVLFS
ncbi:MAG: glucose 1-dehydrogenase [Bacteroidales bacterium]|nr:glucose 1-dehydrogenase [Bacteroidales bacterium]